MQTYMDKKDYYYHLCVFNGEKVTIRGRNEKDISVVLNDVLENCKHLNYKVIGTIEPIEQMVKYVNDKNLSDGIIIDQFEEIDAFKSSDPIFVNVTSAVKNTVSKHLNK